MHVRDQRAFQLLNRVNACIDACDAFATELHLEDMNFEFDPALLKLPPGQTLDRIIPARRYQKLRKIILKAFDLDIHSFRDNKPILIANMIDERILAQNMPFSLDQQLWIYARLKQKQLRGIETFAEQLNILQLVPLQQQLDALLAIGRNVNRHRRHLQKMAKLYEDGEVVRLYQSARRGAQKLRKLMLYDRNVIMADRILSLIREQTAVCAIGAGHLPGERGVLRLLKQRKVRVKPEPIKSLFKL